MGLPVQTAPVIPAQADIQQTRHDLLHNPHGEMPQRIATVGEVRICTSIVVAAELRFGVTKSGSLRLAERVHSLLSAIAVLALESPSDQHFATLRQHLNQGSTPIRPNDMLIAAQASAMGLIVITGYFGVQARPRACRRKLVTGLSGQQVSDTAVVPWYSKALFSSAIRYREPCNKCNRFHVGDSCQDE